MTLTLSTTSTVTRIYALHYLNNRFGTPAPDTPLLCPDQEEALRTLIHDAFAHLVLSLMPRVVDMDDSDPDALTLTLHPDILLPAGVGLGLVRSMENLLAQMVLRDIHTRHPNADAAEQYTTLATDTLGALLDTIDNGGRPAGPVIPYCI